MFFAYDQVNLCCSFFRRKKIARRHSKVNCDSRFTVLSAFCSYLFCSGIWTFDYQSVVCKIWLPLFVFCRLLLRCAEGSLLNDSEVQKAALHVICNCVCGPRVRVRRELCKVTKLKWLFPRAIFPTAIRCNFHGAKFSRKLETFALDFSRSLSRLQEIARNCDWFIALFAFVAVAVAAA